MPRIVDLTVDLLAGIVLSGAGEILDYTHDVRVWYRVLPGGVPGVLTGPYPGEVLQDSRSGVGLVPVAVNDYSPQKGGAEVVPEVWRHGRG